MRAQTTLPETSFAIDLRKHLQIGMQVQPVHSGSPEQRLAWLENEHNKLTNQIGHYCPSTCAKRPFAGLVAEAERHTYFRALHRSVAGMEKKR